MFKKILNFLIFSNLFISICAIAQVLLSYRLLHHKPQWFVVAFVGLATLGMYNFSMVLSKPQKNVNSTNQKAIWSFNHHMLMQAITIITFALAGFIFFKYFNRNCQILMCITGCISLMYNLPIIPFKGKKKGLRNIPVIKVLLISIVWCISCTTLPMVALNYHLSDYPSFVIRTLNSFLFITAITIPFDIRDMYQDKFYHLKTLPVILGKKWSIILCFILLLVQSVLLWLLLPFEIAMHIGTSINLLFTALLIYYSQFSKHYFYYFLFLDGTLLSQYIFVEIIYQLY